MNLTLKNVLLAKFDCSPLAKHRFDKGSVIAQLSADSEFVKRSMTGALLGEYDQSKTIADIESSDSIEDRIKTIDMSLVSHRVCNLYYRNLQTNDGELDIVYLYGDVEACGHKAHAINPHRLDRVFGFRALINEKYDVEKQQHTRVLKSLITIDHCPGGVA